MEEIENASLHGHVGTIHGTIKRAMSRINAASIEVPLIVAFVALVCRPGRAVVDDALDGPVLTNIRM